MTPELLNRPAELDYDQLVSLVHNQFARHAFSSRDLFEFYPALGAESIRFDVIWIEYKFRCKKHGENSLDLGEFGQTELEAFIARYPRDADKLRSQFHFERVVLETCNSPEFEKAWRGDRYVSVKQVGQGWFCTVYLAYDKELKRRVAAKVPYPGTSKCLVKQVLMEAQSLAKFKHPNIVTIYDIIPTKASCAIICEYIADAQELATVMKGAKLSRWRKAYLMEQVADALAHAHKHGIVHRDIKPTNILVVGNRAWLNDFGLSSDRSSLARDVNLLVGSPGYMSPEQLAGELVTEKADIYSLGVVLRELFGPRPPRGIRRLITNAVSKYPQNRPTSVDCARRLATYRKFPQRCFVLAGVLGLLLAGMFIQSRITDLVYAFELDDPHQQLNQVLDEYLFLANETGSDLRTAHRYPRNAELSARINRQRRRLEQLKSGISGQWPKSRHVSEAILLAEADLFVADGKADRAIALLEPIESSIAIAQQANYFRLLGEAYFQQNHWSKTLKCYDRLAKVAAPPAVFAALAARSAIHLDEYERALSVLGGKVDNNSQFLSELGRVAQTAMLQMCQATVYRLQGNLQKSEQLYLEAIDKLEAISQRFNDADYELALCHFGMASLSLKCGNGREAFESLTRCQSLLETIIQRDGRQDAVYLLANTLTARSQLQRLFLDPHAALKYAQQAVELLQNRNDLDSQQVKLELPIALTEQGSAKAIVGQFTSSQEDLQRAVALFQAEENSSRNPILATALANLGYVLHEINQSSADAKLDAVGPLNQALEILENLQNAERMNFHRKLEQARAYMNRGCAHMPKGNPDRFAALDLAKAEQLYVELSSATGLREGILKNDLIVCRMNLACALKYIDRTHSMELFEQVVESLKQDRAMPARINLALAYFNRGIARLASVPSAEAIAETRNSIIDLNQAISLYEELISQGQTQLIPDRDLGVAARKAIQGALNAF